MPEIALKHRQCRFLPGTAVTRPRRNRAVAFGFRSRIAIVAAIGFVSAAISLSVSFGSDVHAERSVPFALLLFLAPFCCFRWWYHPLYRNNYDYISPLALFESLMFFYVAPGNIMAFADRAAMWIQNEGAETYYSLVLMAALCGALVFDWTYRTTSRALREPLYAYPARLLAAERKALIPYAAALLICSMAVLSYLSSKYVIYLNWQVQTDNELDNVLAVSSRGFLMLGVGSAIFLSLNLRHWLSRLAPMIALVLLLVFSGIYVSRILAITLVVSAFICYVASRPTKRVPKASIVGLVAGGVACYAMLTAVKTAYTHDDYLYLYTASEKSPFARMRTALQSDSLIDRQRAYSTIETDAGYRIAGLEFPAAIEQACATEHIPYMYGAHFLHAAQQGIPRMLWPEKSTLDPEAAISMHFGLSPMIDQLSTPISSGYADGGFSGVILAMALLGTGTCIMQNVIWRNRAGLFIYLGVLGDLMYFEKYVASYLIFPVRFALILMCLVSALGAIRRRV